jgi:hypothetical protein
MKENEEPRAKLSPVQKIFKVGDVVTEVDWANGKTEDGKIYSFKMNNGQKVVCKKVRTERHIGGVDVYGFVITEIEDEVNQ